MNPGDLAPATTAVLLQWWLWSALSTLAVLLVVRLLNMRRVEIEDLLMKTLVVAQIGLLLAAAASLHPVLCSHADSERGGSGGIDSTPRIPPGLVAPRPEASLRSSEPTPSRTRRARVSTLEAATTLTRPTHASVARHGIELELDTPRWIPSLIVLLASLGWFWGLLRLIRDVLVSRRLGAAGVAATQAALVATGRRAHERLGLVRRVPLRVVDALPSAMLVGWLRPVVLIPSSWLRPGAFDSERLEMLLVHELAHARRRDLAWRLALRVLGLVSWPLSFHRPLERHLQRVSEVICDRIASKEAPPTSIWLRPCARSAESTSQTSRASPAATSRPC